jgi:hypothetical protein
LQQQDLAQLKLLQQSEVQLHSLKQSQADLTAQLL